MSFHLILLTMSIKVIHLKGRAPWVIFPDELLGSFSSIASSRASPEESPGSPPPGRIVIMGASDGLRIGLSVPPSSGDVVAVVVCCGNA